MYYNITKYTYIQDRIMGNAKWMRYQITLCPIDDQVILVKFDCFFLFMCIFLTDQENISERYSCSDLWLTHNILSKYQSICHVYSIPVYHHVFIIYLQVDFLDLTLLLLVRKVAFQPKNLDETKKIVLNIFMKDSLKLTNKTNNRNIFCRIIRLTEQFGATMFVGKSAASGVACPAPIWGPNR